MDLLYFREYTLKYKKKLIRKRSDLMTLIFAHRGYKAKYPENSMLAFIKALEVGADGIELDVHLTKDDELIVIHDEKLDRTTHTNGYVRDFTLLEIKKAHQSKWPFKKKLEPIPTLKEVLEWIKHTNLFLNIEIKNNKIQYKDIEQKVVYLIRKYKMEQRVILSSFNHCSLALCHEIAPEIETAILYEDSLFQPWNYAKTILATAIHPYKKVATDEIIKESQRNGISVRPWTVNHPKIMKRLFEVNCAGILTDDPELAYKIRNTCN
ncbi:MAG: glycerophosphodiester phosphodiesterase [Bacillales bacterium]|nr:glycerophosphodiester phosphodiesterase [Bacillales bacterium]